MGGPRPAVAVVAVIVPPAPAYKAAPASIGPPPSKAPPLNMPPLAPYHSRPVDRDNNNPFRGDQDTTGGKKKDWKNTGNTCKRNTTHSTKNTTLFRKEKGKCTGEFTKSGYAHALKVAAMNGWGLKKEWASMEQYMENYMDKNTWNTYMEK